MGDFGSATEAMRIIDLFALQIFAKKSGRCNFRLLQHYRPISEVAARLIESQLTGVYRTSFAPLEFFSV
jgi:hypothetical protein